MTCLRKWLTLVLCFSYIQVHTSFIYRIICKVKETLECVSLGALHGWQGTSTWIFASEYLITQGEHLTIFNAVISQEDNLWNRWKFCESVQKQNKLVSTSAHKYMWSDTFKKKLSALTQQWECHMERKKADERNTNCYIKIKSPNVN